MSKPEIKVVGRRKSPSGRLVEANNLLELVVRLRDDKPFIPKGVYRFNSFEEKDAWALKMISRTRPGP